MKYLVAIVAMTIFQPVFSQKYFLDTEKLNPPNKGTIQKAIRIKDSTSFLYVQLTKLDTLYDRVENKYFQLYHLEIGNFSENSICIPTAHFGKHLFKNTVLVLENPYDEKTDIVTLEDCYHEGYSHVCPSNAVILNPNTYFKVSFALDISNTRFKNIHFDYTILSEENLELTKVKLRNGDSWKKDLKFVCKTFKLPE